MSAEEFETREFERKDGSKGTEYKPKVGQSYTAMFDKVGESKPRAVTKKDGKAIVIVDYFLKVKDSTGNEISIKLSPGQAKSLKKYEPLTNKKIVAYEYTNDFGKQVGLRAE